MKRKILLGAVFSALFANAFATPLLRCSAGQGAEGTGAIKPMMVKRATQTASSAWVASVTTDRTLGST